MRREAFSFLCKGLLLQSNEREREREESASKRNGAANEGGIG
jgi:hypothetical protein